MKTNFKLRGWIRPASKRDEKNQREALAAVGCTKIFLYGEDTVDDLIRDLRKGDVVCLTSLARISPWRKDLAPFRKSVHAKGATIWEVTTDRRTDNADDMADLMADAVSELTGEARALTPKEAKQNGKKGAQAKAAKIAKARTSEVHAKSVWFNHHLSNAEVLVHPDFRGWTASSAYRKFKSRGIPSGPRKTR